MVVCQLHLISLKPGVTVASFLGKLGRDGVKPVFQARVLRWMILPTKMSAGHLLGRNTRWDLLLGLLEGDAAMPASAQADIAASWTVSCGVSAAALSGYGRLNADLLSQPRGSAQIPDRPPEATAAGATATSSSSSDSSSQNLQPSREWAQWIAGLPAPVRAHPVSMLNLLAFHPGKKEQYKRYGAEFARRVGSRHGGRVKLVGRVLGVDGQREARGSDGGDGWEEIAYVHYPTIDHFVAMAASEDYQQVNREYRLGALKDTFILCCQEIGSDGELAAGRLGGSKL